MRIAIFKNILPVCYQKVKDWVGADLTFNSLPKGPGMNQCMIMVKDE